MSLCHTDQLLGHSAKLLPSPLGHGLWKLRFLFPAVRGIGCCRGDEDLPLKSCYLVMLLTVQNTLILMSV